MVPAQKIWGLTSGTNFNWCLSNNQICHLGHFKLRKCPTLYVIDYIPLQVGVALGSLDSPQATLLVTSMIAIQFVVTFLLVPNTEQLCQSNKAFM